MADKTQKTLIGLTTRLNIFFRISIRRCMRFQKYIYYKGLNVFKKKLLSL